MYMCISINQSISQNLYSAPSRYLLRGTPNPGHVEKNSLEKAVELRTGTVWEVPKVYIACMCVYNIYIIYNICIYIVLKLFEAADFAISVVTETVHYGRHSTRSVSPPLGQSTTCSLFQCS